MLNQLIIDKDIHSFILHAAVIFIGFYSARLIVVSLPSRLLSILLPMSGPLDVHTGEGMIDFVLVKDTHVRLANGKLKGMSLLRENEFQAVMNKVIVNTVTINKGWCNVVETRHYYKAGLGQLKLN